MKAKLIIDQPKFQTHEMNDEHQTAWSIGHPAWSSTIDQIKNELRLENK